jgi:hypothetical protein
MPSARRLGGVPVTNPPHQQRGRGQPPNDHRHAHPLNQWGAQPGRDHTAASLAGQTSRHHEIEYHGADCGEASQRTVRPETNVSTVISEPGIASRILLSFADENHRRRVWCLGLRGSRASPDRQGDHAGRTDFGDAPSARSGSAMGWDQRPVPTRKEVPRAAIGHVSRDSPRPYRRARGSVSSRIPASRRPLPTLLLAIRRRTRGG